MDVASHLVPQNRRHHRSSHLSNPTLVSLVYSSLDTDRLFPSPKLPPLLFPSPLVPPMAPGSGHHGLLARLPRPAAAAKHADDFNQVPKRFSQFIIDQQNPHTTQKLDNLLLASFILVEVPDAKLASKLRPSPLSRLPMLSSAPQASVHNIGRDISDLMESQATIFSTRGLPHDASSSARRRPRLFQRRPRPQSVLVVDRLLLVDSPLSRRNAIRFKKGLVIYRMWLRMKKAFRALRCRLFTALTPANRSPLIQGRLRTLKRKYREKPRNPEVVEALRRGLSVLAPMNNPNLGQGTHRISLLNDDVKRAAGATTSHPTFPHTQSAQEVQRAQHAQQVEAEGRMRHLFNYIDQQQVSFLELQTRDREVDRKQLREMLSKHELSLVISIAEPSRKPHELPRQHVPKHVTNPKVSDTPEYAETSGGALKKQRKKLPFNQPPKTPTKTPNKTPSKTSTKTPTKSPKQKHLEQYQGQNDQHEQVPPTPPHKTTAQPPITERVISQKAKPAGKNPTDLSVLDAYYDPSSSSPEGKELVFEDEVDISTAHMVDLWRMYLKAVVTSRIKLRQEVNEFRQYMEDRQATPIFELNEISVLRQSLAKPDVASIQSAELTATLDSQLKHFSMNRRLMLGEMLEYDSADGELMISRQLTILSAREVGDYSLNRNYGTVVVRRRGSATGSNTSAATYPAVSSPLGLPMRRLRAVKNFKNVSIES